MNVLLGWLSLIEFIAHLIPGSAMGWVVAAVLARILYAGSFAIVLRAQSKSRMLTRHFGRRAYKYWCIGGMTIMHLDATIFAIAIGKTAGQLTVLPTFFALLGLVLMIVGTVVKVLATRELGSGGYMMKDFFVRPKKANRRGVYKYLTHPMYGLGYGYVYGWALVCLSLTGLVLALFAHIMIHVYCAVTEVPHMKKLYGKKGLKKSSILQASLQP